MKIPTQSYDEIYTNYQKALEWMRQLRVNISPGRTQHYERVIKYWRSAYLTVGPQDADDAFPDFVSSMYEIADFVDIYKNLHHIPLAELSIIADKLQKGVNGPINLSEEVNKSSVARNFIFEALVASRCHEPKNSVFALMTTNSDTGVRVGNKKIWIECKRITSLKKLESNVRDACWQLERTLNSKNGSGHRGLVAIDFSKVLHTGDMLLVKDDDLTLLASIKEIMEEFIKNHHNQWEKVYLSKNKKICGTILRFSTMATSENRNLLVRVSEWAINPKRDIAQADEMVLRRLVDALTH